MGNRYPDSKYYLKFKENAARYVGLEPDNIIPTAGSDNAIKAVIYNLVKPNGKIVINEPSFTMYEIYAKARGTSVVKVQLKEGEDSWIQDTEKLLEISKEADLVAIDDPNNPTGSPMIGGKREIIEKLASTVKGFVLIDEAYYEFAGYTVVDMVKDYPNLLVTRTLSKAFSLAGFRLGYLVGDSKVVKALNASSGPFEIPLPSIVAGITALENPRYAREVAKTISDNREFLYNQLKELGFKVYRSLANFLLIKDERRNLLDFLMNKGIAIKRFYDNYYRISIGTKEQCELVVNALRELV